MADANPLTLWRRFLALPNDSRPKTLLVALLVALVCATAVSVTAVLLKPVREANLGRERQARLVQMVADVPGLADILRGTGANTLETVVIDLDAGTIAPGIDPASFDARAAAADPETSIALSREEDIAGIGRRPNLAPVHFVRDDNTLVLIILPVYGSGYQSTIRAYLALEGDRNTVAALNIYEQGETPGLGSRITDPAWQALWPGHLIADEDGTIRITVARGAATDPFEVDAIAGATRSTTGVTNMLRFWLGERGFGPFLMRLGSGDI